VFRFNSGIYGHHQDRNLKSLARGDNASNAVGRDDHQGSDDESQTAEELDRVAANTPGNAPDQAQKKPTD